MISIDDLIHVESRSESFGSVEVDALREADALQEAQLLDSRVCHLTSTAALLFELRTSLQYDIGNSALLIIRGLNSFDWDSSTRLDPLAALTVSSNSVDRPHGYLRMGFKFFPKAQLSTSGKQAEFYVLEAEGLGEAPPDYSDADLKAVQENLPSWSSACSVLQASILR